MQQLSKRACIGLIFICSMLMLQEVDGKQRIEVLRNSWFVSRRNDVEVLCLVNVMIGLVNQGLAARKDIDEYDDDRWRKRKQLRRDMDAVLRWGSKIQETLYMIADNKGDCRDCGEVCE